MAHKHHHRPVLRNGSHGAHVATVQRCLDIPDDGHFGKATTEAVCKFQRERDLEPDGAVGPETWAALAEVYDLPETSDYPPQPLEPLPAATQQTIASMAAQSKIAKYNWKNRGVAPRGYITGMAISWSTVARKWALGNSSALEMARANTHDAAHDALSWYDGIFDELGMVIDVDGIDTLRSLFTLQIGHGMRESSGRHCCGRDQSAENVAAETAEAGLFQMSWNASGCSGEIQKLFDEYAPGKSAPICAASYFSEGVKCTAAEWACYGSGPGRDYQELAKRCPQFAVESTLIALRNLRKHFGPITRYEAEVRQDANDLLLAIQTVLFEGAPSA
jgi:hypothetical protein